eukprot:Skav225641  [mRNA]  locus=scaffold1716:275274:276818:+ [translate_table: standard]
MCARATEPRLSDGNVPNQSSPFAPYHCVSASSGTVIGLVVPEELLLPEQRAPGLVTLRVDPCLERTVPIYDVQSLDQSMLHLRRILQQEVSHAQLLRDAKQLQRTHGGFAGAACLHEQISASRWGITMTGVDDFMEKVTGAWLRGELSNTGSYSRSKFDDALMGPNIYQVCEQVIKPMTADLSLMMPGVSWALKQSLTGAEVLHFISHAWAEGVFEFHRLLKLAWTNWGIPHDAAAYICFLSNPQNLDIGSMLASINTSPFHVALNHMPTDGKVILIATENAPIHMRLWCVFEAYTAMELEMDVILTGDRCNLALDRNVVLEHEGRISRCSGAAQGAADCFLYVNRCTRTPSSEPSRPTSDAPSEPSQSTCKALALNLMEAAVERSADLIKKPQEGCCILGCLSVFIVLIVLTVVEWTDELGLLILFWALFVCVFSVYCSLSTHFRCLALKGSFLNVRDALCSSPEDAERIKAVIAGKEDKVSALIGNLIITPQPSIMGRQPTIIGRSTDQMLS